MQGQILIFHVSGCRIRPAYFCASTNRKQPHASRKKSVSATVRSTFGCGMPIANLFTACQELIVQSVDLARLTGRDIFLIQGSKLMLGWLVNCDHCESAIIPCEVAGRP